MKAMPAPVTIPATSRLHYLGGMAALNLPSPTGTGDWHMEQTFTAAGLLSDRVLPFCEAQGLPVEY